VTGIQTRDSYWHIYVIDVKTFSSSVIEDD